MISEDLDILYPSVNMREHYTYQTSPSHVIQASILEF
jgi:hypothetical protein